MVHVHSLPRFSGLTLLLEKRWGKGAKSWRAGSKMRVRSYYSWCCNLWSMEERVVEALFWSTPGLSGSLVPSVVVRGRTCKRWDALAGSLGHGVSTLRNGCTWSCGSRADWFPWESEQGKEGRERERERLQCYLNSELLTLWSPLLPMAGALSASLPRCHGSLGAFGQTLALPVKAPPATRITNQISLFCKLLKLRYFCFNNLKTSHNRLSKQQSRFSEDTCPTFSLVWSKCPLSRTCVS